MQFYISYSALHTLKKIIIVNWIQFNPSYLQYFINGNYCSIEDIITIHYFNRKYSSNLNTIQYLNIIILYFK